jgi:hypothetical protein
MNTLCLDNEIQICIYLTCRDVCAFASVSKLQYHHRKYLGERFLIELGLLTRCSTKCILEMFIYLAATNDLIIQVTLIKTTYSDDLNRDIDYLDKAIAIINKNPTYSTLMSLGKNKIKTKKCIYRYNIDNTDILSQCKILHDIQNKLTNIKVAICFYFKCDADSIGKCMSRFGCDHGNFIFNVMCERQYVYGFDTTELSIVLVNNQIYELADLITNN